MAPEHDEDETGATVAEADDGGVTGDAPDAPPTTRRRAIDGRTLAICALVALIAAILAGLLTARLTADDTEEARDGEGTLVAAEKVPDIALEGFDGSTISPTDYAGKPLVINFWASWCTPCIEEMPDFQRVFQSLDGKVAFLGVNTRDQDEAARRMVETTGVTYDIARDTDGALSRALEVTTIPVTVLVLPDGTIAQTFQRQVSAARLCEAINQSLMGQSLETCG